jgi:transcriptional regulator with XRE-family HTH domain
MPVPIHEEEAGYRRRVGRRLLVRRTVLGLSQQQVATAAGVTRNFVSAIERGDQGLDAYRLLKVAGALSIALSDLLSPDSLDPLTGR